MKRYFTKDYAAYTGVRAASLIVSNLPLHFALWIGRIIGLCMYHLHPKRKRIAYANLKAAFSKEKGPPELKRILRRTYKNYGQTIMEILKCPKIDRAYLERYIVFDGLDRVSRAHAKGRGVIYLVTHFGNWELSSLKSAQVGYPIYILARPQGAERLNNLLNSYRERLGCRVIKIGMSSRNILKALRDGGVIATMADQDAGKEGVFIDLLGRPASHAVGGTRLARDTGAVILPAFIIRKKGPYHLIKIEEPMTIPKAGDRNAEIRKGIERHARILESYIARYPDHWMWVYTRWKSTPLRKVVILNDTKRGHLNQSLSALDVIKRCRRDAGYKDEDTAVSVIDVKYKSPLRRSMLSACALFATHRCQGCMRCLRFCLTQESYNALMSAYADIVISCGSSLEAVNLFLSRENNSKNVVIMKPAVVDMRRFDVAIIPRHDRPKDMDNIVITEGSASSVSDNSMRDGADRISNMAALSGKKRLGLLIGGDNPEYALDRDLAGRLVGEVDRALRELDMELLVTTSRRTPKAVEDLLKSRFSSNPRCRFLVVANEKNIENAVGGILALSDLVLVSGESISMVSEAASSGKKTAVFDLKKKKRRTKHDYALARLAERGYIARTPVDRISETIIDISRKERPLKKIENASKMYEKLYRII